MHKAIALNWSQALLSGRYKISPRVYGLRLTEPVTAERLFSPLGVLCEISNQGHWENDSYGWGNLTANYNSHTLPVCVQRWAGMRSGQGVFETPYEFEFFEQRSFFSLEEMHLCGVSPEVISEAIQARYSEL